jgi:DNA polymerase
VFKYDWLVVAIDPIQQKEYAVVNNKPELEKLYWSYKKDIWVGFNCRDYDQYILKAILCGFNPKEINDWMIVQDRKGWEFSSLLRKYSINLFDVMPNPPVGLKALEAFMGKNIHETSVDFNIERKLTEDEIQETISYCRDDVLNTIEVFLKRKGEFDAQMDLLKAFELPLSHVGKTQAQLAAVILDAKKQEFTDEWDIRVPDNLQLGKYQFVADWFLNKENHWYKRKVRNARGRLVNQECALECEVAGLPHKIAWGGIHAGGKINLTCGDDEIIYDVDAGQLYPNIMRHYKLLSRAARKPEMLDHILDTSMRLKAEGKKKEREPYKRQCNIAYGAMGDKTNALYDPLHRNLVCVYGQVFFIDLIEKLEDIIQLLNSNTDGIYFKIKKKDIPELNRRVKLWEERTKLKMEFDEYRKFVSKDVNNYVAVAPSGKLRTCGSYVKELSDLDYDLPIVNEAVKNYIVYGYSVEDTVYGCREFRKFQKVVKLSKLYEWVEHGNGQRFTKFVNKAYRTFASTDNNDGMLKACRVTENGLEKKKFGGTADKCFIFNDDLNGVSIPDKLDHRWYINLAYKRLRDFGVIV